MASKLSSEMARIFITGSTDGLGRAAAESLLQNGHQVLLHARNAGRAKALGALEPLGVVIADLSLRAQVEELARSVNSYGRFDAVIHNAGVYNESERGATPEGHAKLVAINLLAPYLLSAWIERPDRLIFLSSGLHQVQGYSLEDLDWRTRRWNSSQAYGESKLYLTALAFALARRWPDTLVNAVDPGWVRTKMGGSHAPVDLHTGQETQAWLAVSNDPSARVSGAYWHQKQQQSPAKEVEDETFQEQLLNQLSELTAVTLESDPRG